MLKRWLMIALAIVLVSGLICFNAPSEAAAAARRGPGTSTASPTSPAPYPPTGPASNKADGDGPFDVRHTPSVDTPTIRRVLQSYNSPAAGAAEALYRLGIEYGIDPAFCLAFFINESLAGTEGLARVTKAVGNVRAAPGDQQYRGFRKYVTWEQGIEAWYQLIRDHYIGERGLVTVDQIVPVYAPASDGNHTGEYITIVKRLVRGWRGT